MANCAACGRFLSSAGAAVCSACPMMYHKACVACPDKAQVSKGWICPNCKKGVRKGDNTLTPVKSVCEDVVVESPPVGSVDAHLRSTEETVAGVTSGSVVGAALPGVDDFRREFLEGMAEMRIFRAEMAKLRESIDSISVRLTGVERRLDVLEQGQEGAPAAIANLERTVAELKMELNDRDQEALLSDLDISQLPEENGENTLQAVTVLAGRLGVTLEERDVVFAERVGAAPAPGDAGARPRRVVVRLARRRLRDDLLHAARVRRTPTATDGARVYINERLTRPNRLLFHRVREECRRLLWRYFWTKRGRVYARQGDGKPAFPFRSEMDLERVFGPRPTS